MKKILSLLLALMLLLSLTACQDVGVIGGADGPTTIIVGETVESASQPASSVGETSAASTSESEESSSSEGSATSTGSQTVSSDSNPSSEEDVIPEDGWYYSKEDVSLYLYTYGYLPGNFITKNEARDLGWEGGSVERYAPGFAIGGDTFGNREGLLPKADGRVYYECDIDTDGADSRGAKRIVFSNDGLIYYTDDHYESFVLLYGEE